MCHTMLDKEKCSWKEKLEVEENAVSSLFMTLFVCVFINPQPLSHFCLKVAQVICLSRSIMEEDAEGDIKTI